jgi:TldD protein
MFLMQLPIDIERTFFEDTQLTLADLHRVLGVLSCKEQLLADIYCDHIHTESWTVEDSAFKYGHNERGYGAGLRVVKGEHSGFATTHDLTLGTLLHQAQLARFFLGQPVERENSSIKLQQPLSLYPTRSPDEFWPAEAKKQFLLDLDQYTRGLDSRITQVTLSLTCSYKQVFILRDDGLLSWDRRPMIRLDIKVLLQNKNQTHSGHAGCGGRYVFDEWRTHFDPYSFCREALRLALLDIEAQPAPGGLMPVVLGQGWPGVLIHEAVGHGIEADFNRKKTSLYTDKIGSLVASPLCTIVDDPTVPYARGSLNIDDEGEIPVRTVLIENGVLKDYLFDRQNAALMQRHSNGHGRRESSAHMPMPRMTNTFLAAGTSTLEEMLASIDDGIFAVNFGGGSVDITSGQFVFSANEAYRIKKGKLCYPIKGATLTGIGPEVLKNIRMVGQDLSLDPGIGICGKNGQSVPVCVGQPSVKIAEIVVGGTQHENS